MRKQSLVIAAVCFMICILSAVWVFAGEKMLCPQGYRVTVDESFYETGIYLSDSIIYDSTDINTFICEHLDSRVQDWIDSRLFTEVKKCEQFADKYDCLEYIAQKRKYEIVNSFAFKCKLSGSGMAAGLFRGGIKAPLYSTYKGQVLPTYNYPPHAVLTGQDIYNMTGYEGWLTYADWYYVGALDYLPVIGHELDHAIEGTH